MFAFAAVAWNLPSHECAREISSGEATNPERSRCQLL